MTKKERNKIIVEKCKSLIIEYGLSRVLELFPIETPYTRRPSYWSKDGKCFFSAFMWQLNELNDRELEIALKSRIEAAIKHFKLEDVTQPITFDSSLIGTGQRC